MAVLPQNESREELRTRLIQEAAERLRRHPLPPIAEVLDEIRPFRLPDGAPDSTTLLREARGYTDELSQVGPSPSDVAASWEWEDDGAVDPFMDPADLRDRLIDEAEAYRRRYPVPPLAEVVEEIIQNGTYRPADFGAPDCTELIREDRDW